MYGPLHGVKILDLTAVLMGPYCTQILADLGADVIKIENKAGDSTRFVGPSRNAGMSSLFLHLNRNKRSIVLDLKSDEGKEALLELVKETDVFVHSLRPQAIERLGLTYEDLKNIKADLIYCEGYGFGKNGPYRNKPAYDDIIQAASGLAAAQGFTNGKPEYMSTVLADKNTGLMMAISILAALHHREKEGVGQAIEVPMFETMVAYNMEHLYGYTFIPPMGDSYYPRLTSKFRKPYQTKDGYLSVIVYNDKQWSSFFKLIGQPELIEDERYKHVTARTANIDELYQMVERLLVTKTTGEWFKIFEEADIPVMPVNEPQDLLRDPHLTSVDFFEKITHPSEGEMFDMKFPATFSETPTNRMRFAPKLGEHTKEVLAELGYSNGEIKEKFDSGISK